MRRGDFSETAAIYDPVTTSPNPNGSGFIRTVFPANQIPSNRWDPITAKLINAYPTPTNSGRFNNYLANLVQNQVWNQGDVRMDHQASPKDNFFARWSIQNTETRVPSTFPPVSIPGLSQPVGLGDEGSFAGTSFQPAQHAVFSYVRVISPSLLNEFRMGLNRFRVDYLADQFAPGAALGNKLGIVNSNVTPNEQNLPIFSPSSYFGIGQTRSLPIFRRENTFQYLDNMSATLGKHTLKWGVDVRRRQLTIYQTNQGNGRFNFSPAFTDSGNRLVPAAIRWRVSSSAIHRQRFTTTRLTGLVSAGSKWDVFRGRLEKDAQTHAESRHALGLLQSFSEVANRWANLASSPRRSTSRGRMASTSMPGSSRTTELRTAVWFRLPVDVPHRRSRRLWHLLNRRQRGGSLRLFGTPLFGLT
jgi:hypothetical protein